MPFMWGYTTAMVAAAAMAASSALPPARSTAAPDCEASVCGDATRPRGERTSGHRVDEDITRPRPHEGAASAAPRASPDAYDPPAATAAGATARDLRRASGSSRIASTIIVATSAHAPAT